MIEYEQALELLNRAVAEKGEDFIITDGVCQYFYPDSGTPCCIVGHAISYLGYTFDDVRGFNQEADVAVLDSELGLGLTSQAHDLWRNAQISQDQGRSWGYAVTRGTKTGHS